MKVGDRTVSTSPPVGSKSANSAGASFSALVQKDAVSEKVTPPESSLAETDQ